MASAKSKKPGPKPHDWRPLFMAALMAGACANDAAAAAGVSRSYAYEERAKGGPFAEQWREATQGKTLGGVYKGGYEAFKARLAARYRTDPGLRKRVSAQHAAKSAHPIPQPCEACGHHRADRHHDDYDKPLDIRWLCRSCHRRWHKANGRGLNAD